MTPKDRELLVKAVGAMRAMCCALYLNKSPALEFEQMENLANELDAHLNQANADEAAKGEK